MREVTKDQFYQSIGNQNVTPYPQQGPWPYTSLFKTPSGEVRGKVVGFVPEGAALEQKRYYLPE